ncbi:hypothetical protein WK13_34860 [Burkholderia ubonensis]|uniref:hypothetical protein n=1 Tax=Burkholderia ubonensis TaxID=101571 RepID=UPI00075543B7|nr:hypothetical protein [Burkholderia ubonensis]KVR21722.1 hypothetical protein WK13_34860 [Burkholderia ubonensis]
MNDDLILKCLDDIKARLSSIPALSNKVTFVMDDDEALAKIKGMAFPQACYLYEGMHPIDTRDQKGISCQAVFGLLILTKIEQLAGKDNKNAAIKLLDDVRKAMREKRAPVTNHWRFVVEATATKKDTVVIYLQRWAVPVQMV